MYGIMLYIMNILHKRYLLTLCLCAFALGGSAEAADLPTSTPAVSAAFTRDLTLGTHGSDVSLLQQFLMTGGFLHIQTPTDHFGPLTRAALGAWQARTGIAPAVGFFGPVSREKMNAVFAQALISALRARSESAAASTTIAATSVAVPTSGTTSPAIPTGRPVRIRIPKINVDAGFQYTGLTSERVMEIPSNLVDVGWFTESPRPGEKGNAIITGHVAQIRKGVVTKPGVFADLHLLGAGDELSVQNDKGESVRFIVRESRLYDPAADATDVFVASDDGAHLNIITCEGTWNPEKVSYSQRLIIFTDAVR